MKKHELLHKVQLHSPNSFPVELEDSRPGDIRMFSHKDLTVQDLKVELQIIPRFPFSSSSY